MNMGPFVKGMSIGVTVGAITYAMTRTGNSNPTKRMKRTASKALKTMGTIVDKISYMMK